MTHYRWDGEDLLLACHIQPGARSEGFAGQHGDRLKVRIAAAPVDGQANARLCQWLATAFGVAAREVTIEQGDSSRQKRLRIRRPQRLPVEAEIDRDSR